MAPCLAKLDALPVTEWSYQWESPSVRHIGPMAQDFHAAFSLERRNQDLSLGIWPG